jgi:hypothetical protein
MARTLMQKHQKFSHTSIISTGHASNQHQYLLEKDQLLLTRMMTSRQICMTPARAANWRRLRKQGLPKAIAEIERARIIIE